MTEVHLLPFKEDATGKVHGELIQGGLDHSPGTKRIAQAEDVGHLLQCHALDITEIDGQCLVPREAAKRLPEQLARLFIASPALRIVKPTR